MPAKSPFQRELLSIVIHHLVLVTEPRLRHLQFFLHWVVRLLVLSWMSLLLAILDASNFGGHGTCL